MKTIAKRGARKADLRHSFDELLRHERDNLSIACADRGSGVALIAPHGENIEPSTGIIASAIAGGDYNLYRLDARRKAPIERFHVTSTNFDDRNCLKVISASRHVIAIHGLRRIGEMIDVGGLDTNLRDRIVQSLRASGFQARAVSEGTHAAISEKNICNRGMSGKGVQLEIPSSLRKSLRLNPLRLAAFVEAVRNAIPSED